MTTQSSITPALKAAPQALDAIIIGAGFSGLYQLRKLRYELGLNVRALEKGFGVGGTWFWYRYPGWRICYRLSAYR